MIRSASFFILSVSLHVAALAYPVSFGGRSEAHLIHVTILPIEQDAGGVGGQGGSGNPTAPRDEKSHRARQSAMEPRVDPKPPANPEPEVLSANNVATASDSSIALVSAIANSAETLGPVISGPSGTDTNSSGNGLGGTGSGSGLGASGTGSGRGSGSGTGSGSFGTGIALTQASYRDTPRPAYPESARRAGREGRVLLRVLVDDQGRIKQLEINRSSGSDALDRAAAEAMKRWRFHPARYGDRPIESWLRIPIEFHLADATSR
jgi:protein TonB